jgi:hypothetical protein
VVVRDILMACAQVDIDVPQDKQITVCGDVHGQFYDVLNIFKINGWASAGACLVWPGRPLWISIASLFICVLLLTLGLLVPSNIGVGSLDVCLVWILRNALSSGFLNTYDSVRTGCHQQRTRTCSTATLSIAAHSRSRWDHAFDILGRVSLVSGAHRACRHAHYCLIRVCDAATTFASRAHADHTSAGHSRWCSALLRTQSQVIMTFLSFKLLYPQHMHMTRGNHESINMNLTYGFKGN